jgi:olfactory receptor
MGQTGWMPRLAFCDGNTINHNFCGILPLFQISCTSTYVNKLVVLIVAVINITVSVLTIFISYAFILSISTPPRVGAKTSAPAVPI